MLDAISILMRFIAYPCLLGLPLFLSSLVLWPILISLNICSGDYFRTEIVCAPEFLEHIWDLAAMFFVLFLWPFPFAIFLIFPLAFLAACFGVYYLEVDIGKFSLNKETEAKAKAERDDNPFKLLYDKRKK